jgi:CubicO group peptidase (beta-lactamase class C family)
MQSWVLPQKFLHFPHIMQIRNRRILKSFTKVGLALAVAACTMAAAANREAEVDRIFATYAGAGSPGAALIVIRDGAPVLTRTWGMAQVESKISVDATTNFRLASLTKQFTATAVLMLMEQGELHLDDSLRKYFPELPEFANAITIRHLLQHTSGIQDYEPLAQVRFPEQVHDSDVLQLLSVTDDTYFPPGSHFSYSNSGYAMLALLVEKLSRKSFADFLQNNIFGPLEMHNTVAFQEGISEVRHRALGYTVNEDGVSYSDQSAFSAVLGDGGIYSSLNDLYKWDQSLYDNKLLSAATKELAWTPGINHYGFGWWIDTLDGAKRYHHYGSSSGFRNFIQRFPEHKLTIIVLTNRAEPAVQPLGETVARLYLQ